MSTIPPFPLKSFLSLLLLSPALASAGQALQLEQTTVSATRTEQNIDSVPSTVTVHEQERLDKQNVNTIKDLVRHEPGVSVGGTGHSSGTSGYNIRGIDGNRILTQIDGVGIPDAYAFGPYANTRRNYVDPDIIKRVEILRGPASALYGSNAIGGAVSYFTLDPQDIIKDGQDHGARLKLGYSSADESWLTSATVAGRQGDFDALLHYSKRSGEETESQGSVGGNGLSRSKANPEDNDSHNVLAKLGYHYGEDNRLKLAYEHFHSTLDGDIRSAPTSLFGWPTQAYLGRNVKDVIERERFSLENRLALGSALADDWSLRLSYQNAGTDQRTYQPNSNSSRYRKTTYQERTWQLDNQFDKSFALGRAEHQLTYGLSYSRSKIEGLRVGSGNALYESDFPDPKVKNRALYAQDQIRYGAWTFLPGVRYDHETLDPKGTEAYLSTVSAADEVDLRKKSWHSVSPKLGITYDFNHNYSLYGQYAEGFRTPTAKALYGSFTNESAGYRVIGNSSLDPETSKSLELGLRGKFEQGNFSLALFHNRYRDFIEEDSLGGGSNYATFQASNIDKATIKGAEAKARLQLAALGLPQGLYGQGSVAYARGENEDNNQPLNSVNPLTGVFGLGYDQVDGRYGALLNWTLVKRKNRVDDETYHAADGSTRFRTPGFGILDLSGYYQLSEALTLNAGIYNLTDKKYWLWDDVRGYDSTGEAGFLAPANLDRLTQPGRNFSVNLVWDI
ncbi:TonB-dependent hemoglobin/transferrin/lactoferrin family receptor [Stutzerimonas kirkiae]|uniref:TonB-dependent hemoglobin/transferrin/lactoferrin family receptor n=1 Tax=Stutzerimonas kirkiae TaxID=2211392 RepID=UPI0010383CA0|nr:TonB-dependent hemoglobin/transferrin/lactoferrin family receptor [Stutzerimonas kirkiae]TBV12934.1 TonB-dependent hemoglobin/transferrin/lactoferrin family receptor [Stutzerimonas kirkiae]